MLPLFNRNQGNVAAAIADLERARAETIRVQLSLRQSSQSMLQVYLAAQSQADRYKNEMIPRATHAYQLYLAKYRQMASAYPLVLVSQRTLFQMQVAYMGVLQELWSNAIALENYTLSGGLNALTVLGENARVVNAAASGDSAPQ